MTSRAALLALALAAACAKDLDKLAPFPCATDGTCPAPWTCVQGECKTAGGAVPAGPGSWTSKTGSTARCGAAAAAAGTLVYVAGGFVGSTASALLEAYDTVADRWTTLAPMPTKRVYAGAAFVNGHLYVIGGTDSPQNTRISGVVEAYDPSSNSWTTATPLPGLRYSFATAVIGGTIQVAGGQTDSDYMLASMIAWDPASTAGWTSLADLNRPRTDVAGAVVGSDLYLFGGSANGVVDSVDRWSSGTWTARASLLRRRYYAAAGAIDGVAYVVGGQDDNPFTVLDDVEAYDAAANSWAEKASLPAPRLGAAAAVASGVLYVFGGASSGGFSCTSSVFAFTP